MPEPAPDPDGNKLLDSAIIAQDHDSLPGLSNIETNMQTDDPAPADSATSEPTPPADATPCNQMQHNSQNSDDVAPAPSAAALSGTGLLLCPSRLKTWRSCPLQQTFATADHTNGCAACWN
jgi:hypothetical protein